MGDPTTLGITYAEAILGSAEMALWALLLVASGFLLGYVVKGWEGK